MLEEPLLMVRMWLELRIIPHAAGWPACLLLLYKGHFQSVMSGRSTPNS